MNIFEVASRQKVRFPFKGLCSVEDLWDLSIRQLDNIYKTLNRQVKASEGDSLLDERTADDEILELKIDIVKHIFQVKVAERKAQETAVLNAAKRQKLLSIIEDKQDAELRDKPVDELLALANELG